jgi:hypothetical protein
MDNIGPLEQAYYDGLPRGQSPHIGVAMIEIVKIWRHLDSLNASRSEHSGDVTEKVSDITPPADTVPVAWGDLQWALYWLERIVKVFSEHGHVNEDSGRLDRLKAALESSPKPDQRS